MSNNENESADTIRRFDPAPPEVDLYVERETPQIRISIRTLKWWLEKNEKKLASKSAWKFPLCLVIPLIFTRATATFKDVFGLSVDTWRLIYFAVIVVTIVWLICSIVRSVRAKPITKMVDELMQEEMRRVAQ